MADQVSKIDDNKILRTYSPDPVLEVIDVNELKQLIQNSLDAEANYVAARKDERLKLQTQLDLAATVGVTPKIVVDPIIP